MLPRLPDEVWDLIHTHAAALTLQAMVRRRIRPRLFFGHATHASWPSLRRLLLCHSDALRGLYPYPLVRKEWRSEPESWLCDDAFDLSCLLGEATQHGLWGLPCPALRITDS